MYTQGQGSVSCFDFGLEHFSILELLPLDILKNTTSSIFCAYFSLPWPNVFIFLHNVFNYNTQVQFNFGYYAFCGSPVVPLLEICPCFL